MAICTVDWRDIEQRHADADQRDRGNRRPEVTDDREGSDKERNDNRHRKNVGFELVGFLRCRHRLESDATTAPAPAAAVM